jgi:adenylylsulfate kinase
MVIKPKALFIGRFQPFHNGHKWLFEQKLNAGIPILIAIRDILPDEKNPFTPKDSASMIEQVYKSNPNVTVIIIPDIESVNYGRGVGYQINEFIPPENVGTISATQIRAAIKNGDDSWRQYVDTSIQEMVKKLL